MKQALTALVLAATTTTAMAQANGDIIFSDNLTDSIYRLDGFNSSTQLMSFAPGTDFRLGGLINVGGTFYVANGPSIDSTTPPAEIRRLNDLFGGAATSTVIGSGSPLYNPIGLAWDKTNRQILSINNPNVDPITPGYVDGVAGLNIDTLNNAIVYQQPTTRPGGGAPGFAQFEDGVRIIKDPLSDSFYVVDSAGGAFGGGTLGDGGPRGSALWRLTISAGNVGNMELIVDGTDTATTGLADKIGAMRGVTAVGSSVFVTDSETDSIYRFDVDAFGDFSAATLVLADPGFTAPQEMVYNRYTDKLVFSDATAQRIYQMDLDGSNLELLMEGVNARGIAIVPTPATAALLGLGGLVATRRRRG